MFISLKKFRLYNNFLDTKYINISIYKNIVGQGQVQVQSSEKIYTKLFRNDTKYLEHKCKKNCVSCSCSTKSIIKPELTILFDKEHSYGYDSEGSYLENSEPVIKSINIFDKYPILKYCIYSTNELKENEESFECVVEGLDKRKPKERK